jgi:FdhD protein
MKKLQSELVRSVRVKRVEEGHCEQRDDFVAVEEPLGIRLQYWFKQTQRTESLALTMRTPGNDFELVAGFLYTEGIIRSREDVYEIRYIGGEQTNELVVELAPDVDVESWRMGREHFVNSSCGICGGQNLDAARQISQLAEDPDWTIDADTIHRLPDAVQARQRAFAQTGGLHAAALVDAEGEIVETFEDIGRHNALDKLIGAALLAGKLPFARKLVFMSSRGSFELVQKTAAAGAAVLATVGSPSTLAIQAAARCGLTLIGFVRNCRFNVYSGLARVDVPLHSEVR